MKRLLLVPLIIGLISPISSLAVEEDSGMKKVCQGQGNEICMGILLGASICTLDMSEPNNEENVTKIQKLYKLSLQAMGIDEIKDLTDEGEYSMVVAERAKDVYRRQCKGYLTEEQLPLKICPHIALRQADVSEEFVVKQGKKYTEKMSIAKTLERCGYPKDR
tara:strand:+ start:19 stop:507 length:489 start_codon:yes stop_codon:yes gene_type:complete